MIMDPISAAVKIYSAPRASAVSVMESNTVHLATQVGPISIAPDYTPGAQPGKPLAPYNTAVS